MKLKQILLAGAMAASLIPSQALFAQQYGQDDRDQQWRERQEQGEQSYGGPRAGWMRLRGLANQLEISVEHATDAAERNAPASNRYEYFALRRLRVFETEARRFNREIQVPAPRGQRETSFARLSAAYQRSAETFPRLRVWGEGRREFQRASYLMDQISDVFNRRGSYSPGQ